MGQKERDIINEYLLNLPENMRMFRSNSGMAWAGKATKKGIFTIIKNARPFHGMPKGWPDITGFTSIEVTPDMIGKRIAIFTVTEAKTGNLKLSDDQIRFKNMIERMGGIFNQI